MCGPACAAAQPDLQWAKAGKRVYPVQIPAVPVTGAVARVGCTGPGCLLHVHAAVQLKAYIGYPTQLRLCLDPYTAASPMST